MKLSGVITAMVSPFINDHLDEEGLRENIRYQLQAEVDGIVLWGSTGEGATLTTKEKQRMVEIALESAKDKLAIIASTGTNSTQTTIEQTLWAKKMGVDYALLVTPYYNKPTQKGLYQHFAAVAQAVDMPLIIYNVPSRTGVNVEPLTLLKVAQLPNVVAIKESSGNISQASDMLEHLSSLSKEFSLLSGDDIMTLPMMALGGDGVISVLSNLAPKPLIQMVRACQEADFRLAREIHFRLAALFKGIFFETNPIPIKEAMSFCGLAAGKCRSPLCEMSENHAFALHRLLVDAGLAPVGAKVE